MLMLTFVLYFQKLSPSEELLKNLGSQGWDVVALGRAAQKAGIGRVVDIISEFCKDEGLAHQV